MTAYLLPPPTGLDRLLWEIEGECFQAAIEMDGLMGIYYPGHKEHWVDYDEPLDELPPLPPNKHEFNYQSSLTITDGELDYRCFGCGGWDSDDNWAPKGHGMFSPFGGCV